MSEVNRTAARARPRVPKAETLSAFEVADLADRFIGHVEGFLTRDPSIAPIVILGPDPDPQDNLRRSDEHRRESERQFIKQIGPVLAEALQRRELNTSPLLKLLHRVDTATQRENISTIWEDVKVSLQENVLRLRKNRTTVASTPPAPTQLSSNDAGNNIVESSGDSGIYRFILSDRHWTLQFQSEQSECEDIYDGFHYIHALLESASEEGSSENSSATELLVSRNKFRIIESQQAFYSKIEANELLKQIDDDITAAEDADNLERAEELKEQKRFVETELAKETNNKGQSRSFSDGLTSSRMAVRQAIHRAIKTINNGGRGMTRPMPKLADHLRKNIPDAINGYFAYTGKLSWKINKI